MWVAQVGDWCGCPSKGGRNVVKGTTVEVEESVKPQQFIASNISILDSGFKFEGAGRVQNDSQVSGLPDWLGMCF